MQPFQYGQRVCIITSSNPVHPAGQTATVIACRAPHVLVSFGRGTDPVPFQVNDLAAEAA